MYQDNLKNDSEVVMKSDNKKVALIAIGSTVVVLLGIGGVFLLGKQFGGSNSSSSSISLASLSISSKSNSSSSTSTTVSSTSTASSSSSTSSSSASSVAPTPTPVPTPVPVPTTVGYTDQALPGFSVGNLDGWKQSESPTPNANIRNYKFIKASNELVVTIFNDDCQSIENTWNRCKFKIVGGGSDGEVLTNQRMFYTPPTKRGVSISENSITMYAKDYNDIKAPDISFLNVKLTFDTDKTIADTLVSSIQF
jgi:cytoskeletal protein RodZ